MTDEPPVADAYLTIVEEVSRRLTLPRVQQVWLPPLREQPVKSAEFGAVVLEDGSVGLTYMLLAGTLAALKARHTPDAWVGLDPAVLARGFRQRDPVQRVLGLGAANALAQHVLRLSGAPLDTQSNSIAAFDPQPDDHLGMVGYFPPLVARLRAQNIRLTVIELKADLVQQAPRFRVTLDPRALRQCNKILCTSTLLLNDSIDAILGHCQQARQVAVIGPGAGFFPDPLFARGIHTVGGNQVLDTRGFLTRCAAEERWGDSTRKYCLHRHDYPGYRALLDAL